MEIYAAIVLLICSSQVSGQLSVRESMIIKTFCEINSVTIDCGINNVIALQQVQYGYATRCSTVCCNSTESGDCLVPVTDSITFKRMSCSGQSLCNPPAVSSHDFCSFGRQTASYVYFEYYCIPKSRIISVCSSSTITSAGEPLYLTNPGYPGATTETRSCPCSFEANSCSTRTSHFIIDADLYAEPNNCNQSLFITDVDGVLRESIKCESYYSAFVTQKNLMSNYYSIYFESNSTQNLEGYLFIGFAASDINVPLSLSCSSKPATWCIDCGKPNNTIHGTFILDAPGKSGYNSTATVTCDSGFVANNTTITCKEQGIWERASCTPTDVCPQSTDYRCADGECLSVATKCDNFPDCKDRSDETNCPGEPCSEFFIRCFYVNGTSSCVAGSKCDCGTDFTVVNGNATLVNASNTLAGATANVTCYTGHQISNNTITCNNTGLWNNATCNPVNCGSPKTISNGTINASSGKTTYGETAMVNCDPGYNATTTSVSCNSSGTWDTANCLIKDCGSPPTISNGTITPTSSKTTYGETAMVNCDPGYNATMTSTSCNSSGTWDTANCLIKDCGQPPMISNGTINATSGKTTYKETAMVNCDPGYNASMTFVSCNSSGAWDVAHCLIKDCGQPPTILNGTIIPFSGNTTYGEKATVTCDAGFNASSTSVSCNSSGAWDPAQCIIKDCGQPPMISNGTITHTSGKTTYGQTANVNCDPGYNATTTSVSCNSSGAWDSAKCVIKDCGQPPMISNGTINATFGETTYGERATVNCDPGYNASMTSVSCNSSGAWDTAQCLIKNCGQPPTILNGTIIPFSGNTTYGEKATVTCDAGFNASSTSVSCNSSGAWDSAQCKIKDCGQPPMISNGTINATSDKTTFGERATVNCDPGYNATTTSVSCNSSGAWDIAQCLIKDCGSPPTISNGTIIFSSGNTTYGEKATVTCDAGFNASSTSVSCNSSGTWDPAQCIIKDCGQPPMISNGTITHTSGKTTYGQTATVNCDPGYNATTTSVSCNSSGAWDSAKCVIKDCGQLPMISNGTINATSGKTTYGERATVNCDPGYNATTTSVLCNSSGEWDIAQCFIKDCGSPPTISNGTIIFSSGNTTYGERATVTCDAGFNASSTSVSCNSSGTWDPAQCIIKDCGQTPMISNGTITPTSGKTTYGETATVNCQAGFNASTTSVSCNSSGAWDTAQCVIKDCGQTPMISNGTITLNSGKTTYGETATVNCQAGFNASTTTVSCNSSGAWDTAQCVIKDCGQTPMISNGTITLNSGKTTYGETATVNCQAGFNASTTTVPCNSSGAWDSAKCLIKNCGTPPRILNGNTTVPSGKTTYGETATVICQKGYNTTTAFISCNSSGTWDKAQCVIKDCGPLGNLTNGTLALTNNTTTYGSLASVKCDTGYDSSKSFIQCAASELWETAICSTVHCGTLNNIPNGHITLHEANKTSYGSTAEVSCDMGYVANLTTVMCMEDGSWQNSSCNIQDCKQPPKISNGTIALAATGNTTYGASATVSCDEGFGSTQNVIVCTDTGVWEDVSCQIKDCGIPYAIPNGNITYVNGKTTYRESANVTCALGYYSNQTFINCTASGIWSTAECHIKDCGQPLNISPGNITLVSGNTTYGESARVNCLPGYVANPAYINCTASGVWDTAACQIIDCGQPKTITHGNITLVTGITTYEESAKVNCITGYEAKHTYINCTASGMWDSAECQIKDCGQPPSISSGNITLVSGNTTYGESAKVNCITGYVANTAYINCTASGVWDTAACQIIDCRQPQKITNGNITLVSGHTTYGESAKVDCIPGYEAKQAYINCTASGMWNTADCQIKDCGQPASISFGNITLVNGKTTYGESARVNCITGYFANPAYINCTASSVWDTAACQIKDCGKPASISNGNVTLANRNTSYGEFATVSCEPGYEAIPIIVNCTSSGVWDPASCKIKDCGQPPTILFGNLTLVTNSTTYRESAKVNCDPGYEASPAIINCTSNGVWDTANCQIKNCGALYTLSNGTLTLTSNATVFGATAKVDCNAGYISSKSLINCTATGRWETVYCSDINCGSLYNIPNGTAILSESGKTSFGSTARVSCKTGYITSQETITCRESGNWENTSCYIQDCKGPPSITQGSVTLSDPKVTTFGATANVICLPGYKASMEIIACTASATWDNANCIIKDCGPVSEISNGILKLNVSGKTVYGSAAYLECNNGYIPRRSSILCLHSGQWDDATCLHEEVVSVAAALREDMLILIIVLCCAGGAWIIQLITVVCLIRREHRKHMHMTGKAKCLVALGCIPVMGIPSVIYISCSLHNHKYYVKQGYSNWDHNAYHDPKQRMASHHNGIHGHQHHRKGESGHHHSHGHQEKESVGSSKDHGHRNHGHGSSANHDENDHHHHTDSHHGKHEHKHEHSQHPHGTEHHSPSNHHQHGNSHGTNPDLYELREVSHPMSVFHTTDAAHAHHGEKTNDTAHAHHGKEKHHKHHHKHHVRHHARAVKHPDEAGTHRGSFYELSNSLRDHPPVAFNFRSFSGDDDFGDHSGLN